MSLADNRPDSAFNGSARFATTHWSDVCAAGQPGTIRAQAALEKLCATYWYPVYAFIRRQGRNSHDAQDLTQEFFARLLEKNTFAVADRSRGKFRSFLLTALKNFLCKEHERGMALKRGGGKTIVPLDSVIAEQRFTQDSASVQAADTLFERRWALTLLEKVLAELHAEYSAAGKTALFQALKSALMGERESAPYAAIAAQFDMTEGAIKTIVHRMRGRYRALLHAEIANTVATPSEVEEELRYLFSVVST
ncbi:MAG TPA: sigma-70 family RNA polymerase sigma factor [Candidatus Saccharimonadales bacterium]|nr:sigma-70 family RNA polymerase sigma factor [Candidatus Saccharimonadales bacterium]